MTKLDSAVYALIAAARQTPGCAIHTDLGRAVVGVVEAHNDQQNTPTSAADRTAIAAQMLAAVVATDPDRRNTCADMARVAITLTDALLLELAAPVAITAPDRDPR